jgi:transposase-like protein
MDKLVETLGITSLSRPQVSVTAKELDSGPYTFVAADALVLTVRERAGS